MNTKATRRRLVILLNTQGYNCHYCNAALTFPFLYDVAPEIFREQAVRRATLEHLHPAACGGTGVSNYVAACARCNNKRADNPQCSDGIHLEYRGRIIATRRGDYWVYNDGTKKRIKNSKPSYQRRRR